MSSEKDQIESSVASDGYADRPMADVATIFDRLAADGASTENLAAMATTIQALIEAVYDLRVNLSISDLRLREVLKQTGIHDNPAVWPPEAWFSAESAKVFGVPIPAMLATRLDVCREQRPTQFSPHQSLPSKEVFG